MSSPMPASTVPSFAAPPLSPPQSTPPSPPHTTLHQTRPSLSQRSGHAFPATPSTSYSTFADSFGEHLAGGPTSAFTFPPPSHLGGGRNTPNGGATGVGSPGSSLLDEEEEGSIMVGTVRTVSAPPSDGTSRSKGVFKKAFLMDLPSSGAPPSHNRTSSASTRKESKGWRTHSPSESMLGLSGDLTLGVGESLQGLMRLKGGVVGGKKRKGDDGWVEGESENGGRWSHRRALLPTVSRRWRRCLALVVALLFTLTLYKSFDQSDTPSLKRDLERLRKKSGLSSFQTRPKKSFNLLAVGPNQGVVGSQEVLSTWEWKEGEELAALIGFLASEDSHALPLMEVGEKIDPELVLDFDPLRSADLTSDMKEMVEHVWRDRPVVMLGKGHGDPKTRDLRNTLLGMRIVPEPSIFLIDVRPDSDVTVPVLERLASTQIEQFPVLLIGGRSVESKDWLEETLKPKVVEAGATFAKPKKGKKA